MSKLSIITINYNNAKGLEKTIQSVVSQNFKNYEYIVIDGGSNDGSKELIESYSDKISYWVSEKDTGIYNAMNKGIQKAKGEYCLFLNSGDFLCNDGILEKIFSKNTIADILYGELIFDFGNDNKKLAVRPALITKEFIFLDNIWHPASFIKRKLFKVIGLYNEQYKIAADYDFFFHAIAIKQVSMQYLAFPISVYDTGGLSSAPKNLKKIEAERAAIHQSYLGFDEIIYLKNITKLKNKANKEITFFTPTMKRTGSEIVLFNLLTHIDSIFSVKIFSKYKGDLLSKFNPPIKIDFLYKQVPRNFFQKIKNKLSKELVTPAKLARRKNSVWYINTIVLPEIVEYAKKKHIACILHVHELEQIFIGMPHEQIEMLLHYPKMLIANSKATEKVLHKLGRTNGIKICYPAIDADSIIKSKLKYVDFRQKLNIAKETFVWAMCGSLDENKNPFLFIEIACEIIKTHPHTLFIWIGGTDFKDFEASCKQKSAAMGLSDKISWITEPGTDYLNYFNCADGFVLTSKKESFSLVTLEALLLELPVVANNCFGVKEILQNDVGKLVEEANNSIKMAHEMKNYMDGIYKNDIEKGKKRAKEFDIKIWSSKWNEILNDFFAENI